MGNLFGKITTDAGPLEDEINCDCSRSPTQVYNAAQREARMPTTNNVYIDAQHRSRSQSKVYSNNDVERMAIVVRRPRHELPQPERVDGLVEPPLRRLTRTVS